MLDQRLYLPVVLRDYETPSASAMTLFADPLFSPLALPTFDSPLATPVPPLETSAEPESLAMASFDPPAVREVGAVVPGSNLRYTPYGEVRVGSADTMPTDRLYTGQRWDADLGLYDYGARQYDPATGRFAQADTIVPEPGNPQALNRHAYGYNNPVKYNDPSGHIPCIDEECQWGEHPASGSLVPIAGIPDHYSFSSSQWESIQNAAGEFDLPAEFVAAVIAAEIMYDTDWYDKPMDWMIGWAALVGMNPGNIGGLAETVLHNSQDGVALLGGLSFGPGVGQIHAATAIEAEQHFGDAFPFDPRSASERHLLLVLDTSNIMYASGILRMYADQRVGSMTVDGNMAETEMGAVFSRYHEDPRTAFGSERLYQSGMPPLHSTYMEQLEPLVWYYRYAMTGGN